MLINWNLVPCYFGNGNYPYTLFTEMEWIGKLSYMVTDLNTKVNNISNIVDNIVNVELPAIKTRLTNIEDIEIPGIKTRLTNIENVEIPGIKNRLTNIEDIEIPGLKSRVRQNEIDIDEINNRSWVYVLKFNDPVIYEDENNIRTYTLPIVPGYNFANFSCILNCDHTTMFGVKSQIPINITIPIGDNVDRTINLLDYAELTGEYGTHGMITNKITFNSDISFTISYGIDKFIAFTSEHRVDDLALSELTNICITYLKRPN